MANHSETERLQELTCLLNPYQSELKTCLKCLQQSETPQLAYRV